MEDEHTSVNRQWEDAKEERPTVSFIQTESRRLGIDLDLLMREPKNRNERRAREREMKKLPFTQITETRKTT